MILNADDQTSCAGCISQWNMPRRRDRELLDGLNAKRAKQTPRSPPGLPRRNHDWSATKSRGNLLNTYVSPGLSRRPRETSIPNNLRGGGRGQGRPHVERIGLLLLVAGQSALRWGGPNGGGGIGAAIWCGDRRPATARLACHASIQSVAIIRWTVVLCRPEGWG